MASSAHLRAAALRDLVATGCYEVVAVAVADAVIARCAARELVPGTTFRNDLGRPVEVRSFRRSEAVPSFRACGNKARSFARR